MKIYIKKDLRKIPILERVVKMVESYASTYDENSGYSGLDLYRESINNDPVKRFIEYCRDSKSILEDQNINLYISELFYRVKGTYKVFDYITEYLLGSSNVTITYTASEININIDKLPNNIDGEKFCSYIEEFLCELVYFSSLTININNSISTIESVSDFSINHGEAFYQHYKSEEK